MNHNESSPQEDASSPQREAEAVGSAPGTPGVDGGWHTISNDELSASSVQFNNNSTGRFVGGTAQEDLDRKKQLTQKIMEGNKSLSDWSNDDNDDPGSSSRHSSLPNSPLVMPQTDLAASLPTGLRESQPAVKLSASMPEPVGSREAPEPPRPAAIAEDEESQAQARSSCEGVPEGNPKLCTDPGPGDQCTYEATHLVRHATANAAASSAGSSSHTQQKKNQELAKPLEEYSWWVQVGLGVIVAGAGLYVGKRFYDDWWQRPRVEGA